MLQLWEKYVDYPVSYYTGTPQISVPIYDLKDGAVSLPISISYHASGIKVAECASWVGLGWALNAGGMIMRTIKGAPDEGTRVSGMQVPPAGYYRNNGLSELAKLPYPDSAGNIAPPGPGDMTLETIPQIASGASDGEPDLFTFNFNGYGGKFVFDENRKPTLLADQDIKIYVNYSPGGGIYGSFDSWIIVTPDGNKYFFGENNIHEVSEVFSSSGGSDPNSASYSSWLLTKIVYPNTKDTVYFNYTPETYSYFDLGQESTLYQPGGPNPVELACTNDGIASNIYKTTVTGFRIASIISKNYKITFSANSVRQDLITSATPAKALDSVKIFNSSNQCLKQVLFSYNYFTSSAGGTLNAMHKSFMIPDTLVDIKRLKLLSLKEFSGDGSAAKPAYIFNYNENYQLPRRLSFDQDHWGFSNSTSGGSNIKFTPKVGDNDCPTCKFYYGTNANREPDSTAMKCFSLVSIKDPLGALTVYNYEANTSSYSYPSKLIGGLRIKSISVTDSLTVDHP